MSAEVKKFMNEGGEVAKVVVYAHELKWQYFALFCLGLTKLLHLQMLLHSVETNEKIVTKLNT